MGFRDSQRIPIVTRRTNRQRRGDSQIPIDGATNHLVVKFSRLYAEAIPDDQLALRVWMRDIILGRKVESANRVRGKKGREADDRGV